LGHDFKGCDLRVESLGVLQVVVSNLVDIFAEEFGNATFGCFVAGIVVKAGFVGGIVGHVPILVGEAGRPDELGGAMVGFVLGGLREDGHKGMDS
jgi:hypothetical protein